MDNWLELQSAFYVAKFGNVSKAAEELKVHRATVLRHINKLEASFGGKLFIRHAKGYKMTDLGEEMLKATSLAQRQFDKLAGAAKVQENRISGDLIITSLELNCVELFPMLRKFQCKHPDIKIHYIVDDKLLKLEYGEAHIAIRTGAQGDELDCVVQPFMRYDFGLFAHVDYIARYGQPDTVDAFSKHKFILSSRVPDNAHFMRWLQKTVAPRQVTFVSRDHQAMGRAVAAGIGIGFLPCNQAEMNPDLVRLQVVPHNDAWSVTFRMVTHGDIHRSSKVQEFQRFFKDPANHTESFARVSVLKLSR